VLKGWIILQDVGLEVDYGTVHLKEDQQWLVTDRRRELYIVKRSPKAELELVVVGNISVCGSANGHHGL